MELKPRIIGKQYPIRTMPHDVSVVKPVYTWDSNTEVGAHAAACDVVGFIYGNPRCLGEQIAFCLSSGVIADFFEVSAHNPVSGEYLGSTTAAEDTAIEQWVVCNSVRTLSGMYNPRNLVDRSLLLVHIGGGLEITLTQETGKGPYTYRLLGNPEDYLPEVWATTLPAAIRIKLRNLWTGSEGGYTSYFDKRDLTLLKKWLAVR